MHAGSELGGGKGGHRPGSKAAEGARFLSLLRRTSERQGGRDTFSTAELFSLANEANLKVGRHTPSTTQTIFHARDEPLSVQARSEDG